MPLFSFSFFSGLQTVAASFETRASRAPQHEESVNLASSVDAILLTSSS